MEPRAFFEEVQERHALALERVGATKLTLDLAGRKAAVTFASSALAQRLSPALAHRKVQAAGGIETLNILAWDTKASGVSAPSPPWGPNDYRERGIIRGFNRDGIRTAFHAGVNVLSLFDSSTGTAVLWTPDANSLPGYQIGSPFLIILHWWAESQGLTLVHSGAVGNEAGGVLLAGAGGSGKSTTALACAGQSGLLFVSDDYCLLETTPDDCVHTLYSTGKLDEHSLGLLPRFEPLVARGIEGEEKAIMFLARELPDELIASLPVKAILLPKPTGDATTRTRPASPAEALLALAPSTIFQLTDAGTRQFTELGNLVRRIPCFHLDLGTEMRDVPDVVASILKRIS